MIANNDILGVSREFGEAKDNVYRSRVSVYPLHHEHYALVPDLGVPASELAYRRPSTGILEVFRGEPDSSWGRELYLRQAGSLPDWHYEGREKGPF